MILVVGYILSLGLGHLIAYQAVTRLWKRYLPTVDEQVFLPAIVGVMDRFLFTTSYLLGVKEFIAVWLAIKLAGQWTPTKTDIDRPLYHIFLIGNGLNVITSVGAALLIQLLIRP